MNKLALYQRAINKSFPDLTIETAKINKDGQYNDVIIINDVLVFRFAKVQPAIKILHQEIAVLNQIGDKVSVRVPNPIYSQVDSDVLGEVFMGYPMIPGIPLWRPNFRKIISVDTRKQMALQLSGFLHDLHNIPCDSIPVKLENNDSNQKWEDMYQRIRKSLFPEMRPDARIEVAAHFESFLNNSAGYTFTPSLRHGDFGTGNILYDPETSSISGILDFGSIGIGDPAADFAGLFISFGEEFYRLGMSGYPEMDPALDRVHFFCGTFALQEALCGYENGDEVAYNSGMAQYV